MKVAERVAERIAHHNQARLHMQKSEWQKALAVIYKARLDYGDNLLLILDQAACEYMEGSLFSWQKTLTEIEAAMETHLEILSPTTAYNTRLFLGKFKEEQGQFRSALKFYEEVIERSEEDRHKIVGLAQTLRLNSLLGRRVEVQDQYVNLTCRLKSFRSDYQRIEVLHSLMLAELDLLGFESALLRYVEAAGKICVDSDSNLLYFDLLEGALLSGHAAAMNGVQPRPEPADAYERALGEIFERGEITYDRAMAKSEHIGVTNRFRLAALVHRFGTTSTDQERAAQLIRILFATFDDLTVRAFTEKYQLAPIGRGHSKTAITIEGRALIINQQRLDWRRRSTALGLLKCFSQKSSRATKDVIGEVWGAEVDVISLDRLRSIVQRLNIELRSLALVPEALSFDGSEVRLHKNLEIRVG
jgi:tetratricopeptide (TPR) repeat protein